MISPRGYVFLGLNVIRALSIISLLLVFASSIVTLVFDIKAVNHFVSEGGHADLAQGSMNATMANEPLDYIPGSTVPHQPAGAFWSVLNRLLIIFQVIVLLLSELGWPSSFFKTYFPILGNDFGLGPLGIAQILLGATILSHHVDDFALISSWFLFALGCINILLGLVFREHVKDRRSIFAWRERAKDVLPSVNIAGHRVDPVDAAERAAGFMREKNFPGLSRANTGTTAATAIGSAKDIMESKAGFGFGRQGEKAAAMGGYLLTRPLESLPRYSPGKAGSEASH